MGFVECPMCRRAVPDDRDAVTQHVRRDHRFWQVAQLLWRVDPVYFIKQASLVGLIIFAALLLLSVLYWR